MTFPFMISLYHLVLLLKGKAEFEARTAGLSTLIVLSSMIPLLLLIIIVAYRKINAKNLENDTEEKEIFFAELQRERERIRQNQNLTYAEGRMKECEDVEKYLDEAMEKINFAQVEIQTSFEMNKKGEIIGKLERKNIDVIVVSDGDGESTDDELFEMPLPPVPPTPTTSDQYSLTNNEEFSPTIRPIPSLYDTPKIVNLRENQFQFPPEPKSPPPPLPNNVMTNLEQPTRDVEMRKRNLDLTLLPPIPPRPGKSSSSNASPSSTSSSSSFPTYSSPTSPVAISNEDRKSSQPVIIETIPKSLLESDF